MDTLKSKLNVLFEFICYSFDFSYPMEQEGFIRRYYKR